MCTWVYAKCRYPLYIKSLLTYNGLPENLRYYAFNFVSSPARPFSRISRYLKVQKHDMFTKLDYSHLSVVAFLILIIVILILSAACIGIVNKK